MDPRIHDIDLYSRPGKEVVENSVERSPCPRIDSIEAPEARVAGDSLGRGGNIVPVRLDRANSRVSTKPLETLFRDPSDLEAVDNPPRPSAHARGNRGDFADPCRQFRNRRIEPHNVSVGEMPNAWPSRLGTLTECRQRWSGWVL